MIKLILVRVINRMKNMHVAIVMGLVGDCSGGRGTRDSARLKCMFTEIVLLRLDIDQIV